MAVSLATVYQRKKQQLPEHIRRSLDAAANCARSGAAHFVLWNLKNAATDSLCLGMLTIRWEKDLELGMAQLAQGAELTGTFLEYARQGLPAAAWLAHHLIYCNLLTNSFDRAVQLSEWAVSLTNPDARLSDEEREAFTRLLGSFVLDRKEEFAALRDASFHPPRRKLHPFWQWLSLYLDLYQAVLERDQGRFDALMRDREEAAIGRSRDKGLGEGLAEFGGGDESQFVFDFMGVGIAKLARRRGLRADFDGAFLPKHVVDFGLRSAP